MEESSLQIMNTKKHTNTAYSRKVSVQHISRKTLQFYKGYFTILYQMKALESTEYCKFIGKISNFKYDDF